MTHLLIDDKDIKNDLEQLDCFPAKEIPEFMEVEIESIISQTAQFYANLLVETAKKWN